LAVRDEVVAGETLAALEEVVVVACSALVRVGA
jgi:hypothetical protein